DAETRAARRQTTGRRLVDSIRGELDWIVLKALEKDRERRYASAAHLAEDIRRHLSGAPVSAGPPSGVYRIKKFLRRHWLPVSAAAAIAIVLAAGIAVSTWQWRQARQSDLASRASLHQLQRVEIDDAMRRGDFARVERLVAEARASGFPDSDFLLFNELEAREGRNDPSVVQLIESLDVTRLDASLRPRLDYWKADRLLRAGRLEEGSALMQNALNAGLPPLEAALARGTLSTSVQEALDHFQQAVELAPMRSVAQRNLALALGLAGRMEEARHRILLGQSLFPDEQNYFALEALMAAFQNQPEAAMQAAARIPDPAARQAFEALVDQVSTFSNALLLALCGNNPVSLLDKLKVGTAVMRFQALGGQDAPFGLSGMAPVLIRGLTGLMQGLIANFQSPGGEQGIQAIERALKSNDEGTLWAVLGVMHFSRDEYDRAIEAFLKAQNTPALLPHIRHAARLMEGAAEAGTWMRTMDAATLQRAESALRDAYESDLPDRAFEAIFGLAHSLALTVKDRSLARRIAQRLPRDSPKQLDFVTKIEYAEGNRTKALAQARRAVELHPTDEALQRLVASIEAGTLSGFETYAPKP
ncbi:MAG: hypothetical protein ACKV19_07815, partial [Verrucomicrobiales bacterium]